MSIRPLMQASTRILACILLFTSGFILLSLVGLTVIEVFSRYILNAPIDGKQDISKLLLATCIFLSFPIITLRREHVDVDLLDSFFSPRADTYRRHLIDIFVSVVLLVISFWVFEKAEKFYIRGSVTDVLSIPIYPFTYFVSFLLFFSGLLLFLSCLYNLFRGR